jgi:hypothetical protein
MAYARLHLASTLLVLTTVALVPAADVGPDGAGAALLPVAIGYAAVQAAIAAHVGIVQLWGLGRAAVRHH